MAFASSLPMQLFQCNGRQQRVPVQMQESSSSGVNYIVHVMVEMEPIISSCNAMVTDPGGYSFQLPVTEVIDQTTQKGQNARQVSLLELDHHQQRIALRSLCPSLKQMLQWITSTLHVDDLNKK
jgi:hypothetical protein